MGDHSAFLGKSLHMLRLLLEMAERDEEGEVGVLVTGRLEHGIEGALHPLPEGVAPGADHHAAADLGVLRHLGTADDLLVPLGEILLATRGNSAFIAFAHKGWRVAVTRHAGQAQRLQSSMKTSMSLHT